MTDKLIALSRVLMNRFFMTVGVSWLFTTLIGPQIDADFIILGSAAVALVSLLVDRPKLEATAAQ